jgi:hypothetical protein
MGVYLECYEEVLVEGVWLFAGEMIPNPRYRPDPGLWADDPHAEREFMPRPLFESNSKELAAILTGVGDVIRSSEPYTPVVPRRGLPSDLSPQVAEWLRLDHDDSVDENWFTRGELEALGWETRIMKRRAMVDPRVAGLFSGCPRGFPSTNWPKDLPVSFAEWQRDGITVEWLESYAEIAPDFHEDVPPRLAALGPPEGVRLVVASYW